MDDIANLKKAIEDLRTRLHEEVRLRTELERRCRVLEKLVYRDPTTGLRTEAYLHARVREEIQRCVRYPASASLVTICAPRERTEVIGQLGLRLGDELRESDQVFKLDPNGLAMLLVETPAEGAKQVMDRLAADLEHFIRGYGYAVTNFPVEANLAEDFMNLALERHNAISGKMYPAGYGNLAQEQAAARH